MSNEINDAREVSTELTTDKRTVPAFGPGHVNLAVPDRGHIPSCIPKEFNDADAFEAFCAEHPAWLTVMVSTRADKIFAIFQILKDEVEQEEMRIVGRVVEEQLSAHREKRKADEAARAKLEAEKAEADDECRKIGRLCIEKHGVFVKELPGLSKLKGVRKSIADDILKLFNGAYGGDAESEGVWAKELQKILNKYVKEGA